MSCIVFQEKDFSLSRFRGNKSNCVEVGIPCPHVPIRRTVFSIAVLFEGKSQTLAVEITTFH